MQNASQQIECVIPVVPVSDIARSVNFYLETLGFILDWGGEAGSCIGSVSRDGHCLMLMKRDPIAEPVWIWIGVEDESLFDIYRSRGVKVRQEPKNFSWAYEMKFEDPDGNVLWLGTEPRKDLPLEDR